MPAGCVSLLRHSHLQIGAFQGEEMEIKSPPRCISGRAENRKPTGTTADGMRMLNWG